MTTVAVTYDEHRAWGRPGYQRSVTYRYRPFEEITIHGPMGSKRLWCLVDTGADRLQVHTDVALIIGINPTTQGQSKDVQLASGGTSRVTEVTDIKVDIEGQTYEADCLFGSNKIPILGRETILSAIDIGFDVKGWFLKLSAPQSVLKVRVDNYKEEKRFVDRAKNSRLGNSGPEVAINGDDNYNPPMSVLGKLLDEWEVEHYSFDLSIENIGETHIEGGNLNVELVWLQEDDSDEPEVVRRWDITDGLVNLDPGGTDELCSIKITSNARTARGRFFQIRWILDLSGMASINGKLDLAQIESV